MASYFVCILWAFQNPRAQLLLRMDVLDTLLTQFVKVLDYI